MSVVITLGVAVIVLLLGGLLMYMSQLLKNAYQIKIEMQAELDAGLHRVEEDADKKLKWLKRDVFEELEKSKHALAADNNRRFGEIQESLAKTFADRDELLKRDRAEVIRIVESQRDAIRTLDQRLRTLRREQRRTDLVAVADPVVAEDEASAEVPAVEVTQVEVPQVEVTEVEEKVAAS